MASEVYHGSDMGHTPELKLEGEGDQAKACGSIECAEHWSLLPWDRSYHSPGWGLELPPWSSHSGRQAGLPRAVPTLPSPARSQRGGSHQGDEVGECEGQRDLYTLPLVCWPELLVVAFLFE